VQYEIYSVAAGDETVHCRGEAVFSAQPAPARLDLDALRRAVTQARLDSAEVYRICATMGLHYGPAHQSVAAIHIAETQVLADLRLPVSAEDVRHRFVLHPSLMDGALQASLGLFVDLHDIPTKPWVPFSLEGVRIFRPCTSEMVAWVRRSSGGIPGDRSLRVDADLCDLDGNVAVQVQGFVSRALDGDARAVAQSGTAHRLHLRPRVVHQPAAFDGVFYESLIADVANRKVSVDEAVDLG